MSIDSLPVKYRARGPLYANTKKKRHLAQRSTEQIRLTAAWHNFSVHFISKMFIGYYERMFQCKIHSHQVTLD